MSDSGDTAGNPVGNERPLNSSTGALPLRDGAAAGLVFGSSAAVLVIEIVALRLLAPYFGLTLETSTFVIAIALAAIALGSWAGGRVADRRPPRTLIAPLLAISGIVTAATPLTVRLTAETGNALLLWFAAAVCIMIPGSLLSAVSPAVIKLQLSDLNKTGRTVGRLSGIGTVGSIVGTVLTGFVFISRVPVSTILYVLGVSLIVIGLVIALGRQRVLPTAVLLPVAGLLGLATLIAPGGCDRETTYNCLIVQDDEELDHGFTLVLNGIQHSFIDPTDPSYFRFSYTRATRAVINSTFAAGEHLDAYHIGGGGLTLARYLAATRPESTHQVSEIDPGVVEFDGELLSNSDIADLDDQIDVQVEDARLRLGALAPESFDLIIGDAFGGVSVPWHLTTVEALAEIRRSLTTDGSYVMNTIDHGDLGYARAQLATIADQFDHLAVLAAPETLDLITGGNVVLVGSSRPIPGSELAAHLAAEDLDWNFLIDDAALDWTQGAQILRDDFAPVDQLLTPYAAARN